MVNKGWNLTREELAEAAEASGDLNVLDDYVDKAFRTEWSVTYLMLKVCKPKTLPGNIWNQEAK